MTACSEKELDVFKTLWDECEPFYGGTCTTPDYQMLLCYTLPDSDVHRRINLSNAGTDELAALYAACKPAEFGLNREAVLDETYRKATKMDLDSFSTLFDPHSLGIFNQVSRGLLTGRRGTGITDMELYKLNVYGEGDFFKPHKDTPRSESMVGSLVVILPTQHEGGQLVLRQGMQEWTFGFADKFAATTDPMVYFVAFFGDVEHEVLPVTSGYRVTLTYNLYDNGRRYSNTSLIPTPFHKLVKGELVELINDKSILPEGGYLGYGLVRKYEYNEDQRIDTLLHHLKGADQILATICEELGLRYSLRFLYRNLCNAGINLITHSKLTPDDFMDCKDSEIEFFEEVLRGLTADQVEGVEIISRPLDRNVFKNTVDNWDIFRPFHRDPVTKILEIQPESSVQVVTNYALYGEPGTDMVPLYGEVFMLIALDPVVSRKELVL